MEPVSDSPVVNVTPNPVVTGLKRRPYLYGFILGAIVLTVIRPCLIVEAASPGKETEVRPFQLLDQHGANFSSDELADRLWVAGFFSTRSTSRAIVLKAMKTMDSRAAKEGFDMRFVLFSVDPDYDTPKVLSAWAALHELDPARWHLLTTNDSSQIRRIAVDQFRAPFSSGEASPTGNQEAAQHSEHLWLVDKDGFIRSPPERGRSHYKTSVRNNDDIFEWARVIIRESTTP